ncbi:hypothetical protein [Aeromicrobium flavum]|nr:hypothetical protein [Aeromicrobium flavum]
MTTTLTDRYVHAATRWMPGRVRHEVEAELRERIEDTVEAQGGRPEAEREALEILGDPLRIGVEYIGREPALLGPRMFFPWLRLTALLVVTVAPIVAAITMTVGAFEGDSVGAIIGGGVWTLLEMVVHLVFWTTLVFVVLDWTGISAPSDADTWSVDQLPDPRAGTGLGDLVAAGVFLPFFAALLVWQHVSPPFVEDGDRLAVLDPDLWSWYLPLVLVTLALELAHAVWVYRRGWTWPAAWANLGLTLLFAVPTIALLLDGSIVNPELVAHFDWDPAVVEQVLRGIAVGVGLVSAWEAFDGFRKAQAAG